jgi:hypothetical protein
MAAANEEIWRELDKLVSSMDMLPMQGIMLLKSLHAKQLTIALATTQMGNIRSEAGLIVSVSAWHVSDTLSIQSAVGRKGCARSALWFHSGAEAYSEGFEDLRARSFAAVAIRINTGFWLVSWRHCTSDAVRGTPCPSSGMFHFLVKLCVGRGTGRDQCYSITKA